MCEMEGKLEVKSFFMMDENFLLHKRRALELLELMKAGHKAWSLYVFSSANAISQYTMRELVELGVSWIWMGLESPRSAYIKLKGADTIALTARTAAGTASSCWAPRSSGWSTTRRRTSKAEIEHAVAHDTDFHQFMLYTPVPGTPLFFEMKEQGRMLPGVNLADIHGQHEFNFAHAAISREGFQALAGFRLPARFRAQRPQHLPHLPHHAGWLPALQERCRFARPRALRPRGARVEQRLRRGALGDGAAPAPYQSRGGGAGSRRCARRSGASSAAQPRDRVGARPLPACGPRAAKRAGWPRARPTSRPPSSSAATGRCRKPLDAPFPRFPNWSLGRLASQSVGQAGEPRRDWHADPCLTLRWRDVPASQAGAVLRIRRRLAPIGRPRSWPGSPPS